MNAATQGRPRDPKAYRPIRSVGSREWLVQSSTHKEIDYHVFRCTPRGALFTCDCPWGANRMGLTGKDCRHVKAVKQRIGLLPKDRVEAHTEPVPVADPEDGDPWADEKAAPLPQDRRSGPWPGITDEERLAGLQAFWKKGIAK